MDGIKELLHPSTQLWGLHDSGAYQDIEPYNRCLGYNGGSEDYRRLKFSITDGDDA